MTTKWASWRRDIWGSMTYNLRITDGGSWLTVVNVTNIMSVCSLNDYKDMMTSSNGNISALLAICAGNSPVTGEFSSQRPVTRSFDVFFDLRLNKRLSKQSSGWWFETPSRPLWRHCNDTGQNPHSSLICFIAKTSGAGGGGGLLKIRSLISPLRESLILQKYRSDTFNHVHICQVSPQLSCGDTCQTWTWQVTTVLIIRKKWENNGTEKIGLVTPIPVDRTSVP